MANTNDNNSATNTNTSGTSAASNSDASTNASAGNNTGASMSASTDNNTAASGAAVSVGGAAASVGGAASSSPMTLSEATASATTTYGFRGSYMALKPTYDRMPAANLPPVTLDVNKIIVLGMGVFPKVRKLRADIFQECPRLPVDLIDQTEKALFGLAHSNILKQLTTAEQAESTNQAAAPLRVIADHLQADVAPLVARGLVAPEAVVRSQGNNPRNAAFDVLRLVEVADSNYHHLEGATKLSRAELQAAAEAARALLEFLAAKEQSDESAEEATLTRLRALAHFVALYEELRWAVRYTRRNHKDAHLIMPSLYSLRKKRTTAAAADDTDDEGEQDQATTPAVGTDTTSIDLGHLQALMNGGGQATASSNGVSTSTPSSNGATANAVAANAAPATAPKAAPSTTR